MLQNAFVSALAFYLHATPDFRGKWRLLRAAKGLVDGLPVRTRFPGITLTLAAADRTNQLCVLGKHEPTVAEAVNLLQPGDCFVDIGANCGLYSIMASQRVGLTGLVISFEPCDSTFAMLQKNLRLNGIENVIALNSAVAETAGIAGFDTSIEGHTGRFSMATPAGDSDINVKCSTIECDDPIGRAIGNRSTVIKVDVEGFEVSALKGVVSIMSRPETQTVVVEIDELNLRRYGETGETLYSLMGSLGFSPAFGLHSASHYDEVFTRLPV